MTKSRQRLYFILFILTCLFSAVGLALYALQDNVSFFYTPSEVYKAQKENPEAVVPGRIFRLGGMVKKKSLKKTDKDMAVRFVVTDFEKEIPVSYTGILPDLFREGQGVVGKGTMTEKGVFEAAEILAKHDENYMPPELAKKGIQEKGPAK
jgi:cytochrome c-type biogenesis protein CcmE